MRVSVVCTVLNEGESARRLMDSLAAQTRPPDEVVIVDGGSHDDTIAILSQYHDRLPLKLLTERGANISRGRNVAIENASGDLIAVTDAGVWLEPEWLAELIKPLEDGAGHLSPTVSGGFFVPDTNTPFEIAMGATVLPDVADVKPDGFLPSSRSVAFRPAAWAAAGQYPEWLDYCEDLVFDLRLRETNGAFGWAPRAVVHFRPRGDMRSFFRQYYRYARGDGKADLWRVRHAIRYATYLVGLPALLLLSRRRPLPGALLAVGAAAAYTRRPYARLWQRLPRLAPLQQAQVLLLVPAIRLVGDVAKMLGYPVGLWWRARNWDRKEIHWR